MESYPWCQFWGFFQNTIVLLGLKQIKIARQDSSYSGKVSAGILLAWVRFFLSKIFNSFGKSLIQTWLNFSKTQSNDVVQPTTPGAK